MAARNISLLRRLLRGPYVLAFALVLFAALGATLWRAHAANEPLSAAGPLSRQVLQYQETIIMNSKPAPTTAALEYAYVASAYNDGLDAGGQAGGLQAASGMLQVLYAEQTENIIQKIQTLAQTNHVAVPTDISMPVQNVITKYHQRYLHDGHDLKWDGVIPTGPGKWVKLTPKGPFTPRAGDWQRWNVTAAISVPPPPVYGSAEDIKQLEIVKQAAATRNGEDVNIINFWGGTPGTATPSGIWQNQLFVTIQKELPGDALKADKQYALVQKMLAQSMSDAFMECWKVKYTYWTARPNMRATTIVTAMENPPFPGYISGHSTISKAAAGVLSVMVPKHASEWESMAMQARQSRLKAGIHFEVDNAVGYQVGANVAQQTIAAQQLSAVVD